MRRLVLLALAGTVFAGNAFAANSPITGTFQVRATVPGSCVVMSKQDIDFGTYDPVDVNSVTADSANGNLVLRCTKDTAYSVELNEGIHPVAAGCTAPARRMANAGNTQFINYVINGSDNNPWGCGTADRDFTAASSNTDITLVTYGLISAGQDVSVGSYSDTVTYKVIF